MEEYLKRYYVKEEEFVDEFFGVASVAAKALNYEWRPDDQCNDATRKSRDYFLSTGELEQLTFMSAAVYHTAGRFSSAQIILESSKRVVNVRVKKVDGELVAEKIVDKPA